MRRADRQDSNYDNSVKYPRSQIREPMPLRELQELLQNVRSQRDEWKQVAQENEAKTTELVQFQQELQSEIVEWKERNEQNHRLYCEEQQKHQQTLILYENEKTKSNELLGKYEEADALREKYLTLYSETQRQLKHERRSKAGIKSWETRRKRENERLKQEISEMMLTLKDSLERKDEAINNLYVVAERMDRIQQLVDSVEEEPSSTPIALLDKLKRIWIAVREILAE